MVDSTDGIVWEADATTFDFTFISKKAERLLGYRVEDWLKPGFWVENLHPDDRAWAPEYCASRTGRLEPHDFEYRFLARVGRTVWLHDIVTVVAEDGAPRWLRGIKVDITEHKLAEDALRESEARFRAVFDTALDAVVGMDAQGRITDWNARAESIFGWSRDEALRRELADTIIPQQHREAHRIGLARFLATGEARILNRRIAITAMRRNGEEFPVELAITPLRTGDTYHFTAFIADITDRKLAEEALRESEARFRAVVDTVPAAIRIYDGDRIVFANGANTSLTGYCHEEVLAPGFLQRLVHPEDLPALAHREARRLRGEPDDSQYTSRIVRKDGHVRWIVSDAVPITFDGRPATLVTSIDITERKQAEEERRKLDLQVQHAQKLESLGVLAGGIAHDFNNLLVAVLGNASLALMELSPESPARETIESIEVAARRAADLTGQMLAYSGKGHFLVGPLNLPHLVEEMGHLLVVAISKQATLAYHFAPDTPLIQADATQIRQVVMNLITNASDAIGDTAGVIAIGTGMFSADRAYLSETYLDNDLPEGDYAFVEVTDTGSGMDEETRLRIFDPFFTTKFTGRGLGLAAVLGIVRGHHGAIKISSEVGRGTTFRVLFPVAERSTAIATAPATKLPAEPAPSNATILLVDDDATVRTVTRRILERFGYIVIAARDGNEALALFQQQTPFPDLVLLDLTMPGMDGRATFRELRRIDATARIVLMSGYGEADATEQFSGEDLAGFIQKPFHMSDLLTALTNALA